MGQYNHDSATPGRNQFGVSKEELASRRNEFLERQERLKASREYFEVGCLCILNGDIDKKPTNYSDELAVNYYEANCNCSRNYIER